MNQLEIAASSLEQFQLRRQIISEWALGKKNTNWFWDKNPYNHLLTTTVRITVLQIKLSLIVFFIVKANLWLTRFSPSSLLFVCLFPLYQPCSTTGLKIHIQLPLQYWQANSVFNANRFFFPPNCTDWNNYIWNVPGPLKRSNSKQRLQFSHLLQTSPKPLSPNRMRF